MRKVLIAAVSLLALAACQKTPAANADPRDGKVAAAPAGSAATRLAAPLTEADAFRMAFGSAAPAVRKVTRPDGDYEEALTYSPARLAPLGELMVLVSTASSDHDCHACSGALAIHYFKRQNGSWVMSGAWPEILPGTGFGAPPDFTIRTDLGRPTWLQAEGGWSGQGYTCTSADLIELTPQGPVVRGENIPLHYDNAGVVDDPAQATTVDGKLDRGPDGKLRVTFTGSKTGFTDYDMVGGKLTRVSGNVIDDC